MNKKRVAIIGISGRMGTELCALAHDFGLLVTEGVAANADQVKYSGNVKVAATVAGLQAASCDVVIDFSLHEATIATANWCAKNRKPLISGVTGLKEAQMEALKAASANVAVLWSPNMSLGVAVLSQAMAAFAALEGFDFQIEEVHHKNKKDRPSGTARLLQDRLQEVTGQKCPEPVSIRGGGVFGVHRVFAMGEEETLTFEHTAMNRRVFARGALKAAAWIIDKPAGLYRIGDVLKS